MDPPLTVADRPAAAAGALSLLEPTVTGALLGYQLLGGIDYAVGDRTTVGISAHWPVSKIRQPGILGRDVRR